MFFLYQQFQLKNGNIDLCLKFIFFEIVANVHLEIIFPEVGQKNEQENIETEPLGLLI